MYPSSPFQISRLAQVEFLSDFPPHSGRRDWQTTLQGFNSQ